MMSQLLRGNGPRNGIARRYSRSAIGDDADRLAAIVQGKEALLNYGGGGGSRTRVRKCYWSRDYMLIRVHALGITRGRSRPTLRTDKKR